MTFSTFEQIQHAVVALIPMMAMLVGFIKLLQKSERLVLNHLENTQRALEATERVTQACVDASAAAQRAFALAEQAGLNPMLPTIHALAVDALRALHTCHGAAPAPQFERARAGSRFSMIELT